MADQENNGLNLKTRADLEKYLQDLSSKLEETQASLESLSNGRDDQGTNDQGTDDQGTDDQGTNDQGTDDNVTDEEVDELQALLDLD